LIRLVYWLGPTCKKMMDLKSPDKIFKSAAFIPTDEELREYARSKRRERKEKANGQDMEMRSPSSVRSLSPTSSIPDVFDDSDEDDLPDVAQMLKKRKEKMQYNKSKVSIFKMPTSRILFLSWTHAICRLMESLLNVSSAKYVKATRIWKLLKGVILRKNVAEVGMLEYHQLPKGKEKLGHRM